MKPLLLTKILKVIKNIKLEFPPLDLFQPKKISKINNTNLV